MDNLISGHYSEAYKNSMYQNFLFSSILILLSLSINYKPNLKFLNFALHSITKSFQSFKTQKLMFWITM